MRKLLSTSLTLLFVAVFFAACDSYVEEIDLPIDSIETGQLNDESQVPFVIAGIETRFASTFDRLAAYSDGLSDQLIFDDRVPNATFPTFREIDLGDINFANNSVDGVYNALGELRYFSDDILERLEMIEIEDAELLRQAQFAGHFYGGVARYFFAVYIGLEPRSGGGVIDAGPFIPSSEMYAMALEKLNTALGFANAYETRVINTLIARIHLYQGNFSAAQTAAQNGLMEGDDPFQALYSVEAVNEYWGNAGRGRTQWAVAFKYNDIVTADPAEAARVPIEVILGTDNPQTTFYRQIKYPDRPTPIPFATWQENALMLAELAIRGSGDGLAQINAVRASSGLGPLATGGMDVLMAEREKELFATGMRLADQRRFDIWHLGAGTWQFLPITQGERNQNENF
jgi:hypothetical protein